MSRQNYDQIVYRYLTDSELDYELKIRALKPKTERPNKLKCLNRAIQKNVPIVSDYDFVYDEEKAEIEIDIASIETDVQNVGTTVLAGTETQFKTLQSRLAHLTDRVDRILSCTNAVEAKVSVAEWRAALLELESDVLDKFTIKSAKMSNVVQASPIPAVAPRMSLFNTSKIASTHFKSVPVHKWGVHFDGKSDLLFFLEKVNDLMIARKVSEDEVFASAFDLFVGPALIWYRSIKGTVSDWDELVTLLKSSFLPSDNDDALWEELRAKKQQKDDSVVIFVATMDSLFSRLKEYPDEKVRLRLIMKNLQPHYISALALADVDSIDSLLKLTRKLDEAYQLRKLSFPANKSAPARVLTVRAEQAGPSLSSPVVDKKIAFTCWNCKGSGHNYRSCTKERNKFCFKCGKPDVTVKSCPKCQPNGTGNAQ